MAWTRRDNLIYAPLGAAVHFGRGARLCVGRVFCRFNLVGTDADGKACLLYLRRHECGAQRRESQQWQRASHCFGSCAVQRLQRCKGCSKGVVDVPYAA